jgi:predicted HTH transcriptional regulator
MNTPYELLALPTFSRMAFSILKMGMLIAASRKQPTDANKLEVDIDDLQQAAFYVQKWGQYSLELIMASGKSTSEKQLERALGFIASSTEGVTQSQLMQRFHISSREMKEIRDTLYDRGLVEVSKRGRGLQLKAIRF